MVRDSPECGAIKIRIEVSGASHFDTCDALDFTELGCDLLRNDAWSFFQTLGQLEADRRCGFSHFDFRRAIESHIHGNGVVLLDVAHQGFAKAIRKR